MRRFALICLLAAAACKSADHAGAPVAEKKPEKPAPARWEVDNPVVPLPKPPLGAQADFAAIKGLSPEKVRLGKWLFYDKRLSSDATVSCATCHRPEHAFSEPTAHSTGVGGQEGARKAPSVVNAAWPVFPVYFWDGRAASLAEQAKGPIENPIEMASTHADVVKLLSGVAGYKKAFREVYGDDHIDIDRVADAIAAYEATRLSGNSAYDRFDAGDQSALTEQQKKGRELFFGKAQCNQCHLGWNFTDSQFHNLGVGWDPKRGKGKAGFADLGRAKVTNKDEDIGAFKTPTLRDVSKHAPYMHDGSMKTLREVVLHYDKGGNKNPWLSKKIFKLKLEPGEVDALVAFLEALDGEGYADTAPKSFPE